MTSARGIDTLDFRPSMRQTMVITRASAETGGRISRVEIQLEAGQSGPPAHIHPEQREIYTVEAGELTISLDGDSRTVRVGGSLPGQPGQDHQLAHRSGE